MTTDSTAFETALAAIKTAHASEVRALLERIDAAELMRVSVEAQLTEANSRADRAEVQVITERARADHERQQADELRGRLEKVRDEARMAQETAEALRRVDEARRARSPGTAPGGLAGQIRPERHSNGASLQWRG